MKLTAEQIETIERYLLDWDLTIREFYDELLDHYCTAVENRMEQGENFDEARIAVSHELAEDVYSPSKAGPVFYGPKAMEQRFVANSRSFKKDLSRIVKVIRSPWILTWALMFVAGYAGWKYDLVKWTSLAVWFVNIACLSYASFKGLKLKDLPVWLIPGKRFPVERIKSAKLKSVYSEMRIIVFFWMFIGASNFFDEGTGKQLYILVISLLCYPLALSYVLENRIRFNQAKQ